MAYQRYQTDLFSGHWLILCQGNVRERLEEALKKILDHPELHDGQLKGPLAGHFKKKAAKKKYRIIYRYCRFCLQTKKAKCKDCAEANIPDNAVIFCEAFLRGEEYD